MTKNTTELESRLKAVAKELSALSSTPSSKKRTALFKKLSREKCECIAQLEKSTKS